MPHTTHTLPGVVRCENPDPEFMAAHDADVRNIGTLSYAGVAYFWHSEYHALLMDATAQQRVRAHHALMLAGVRLCERSVIHASLIQSAVTETPERVCPCCGEREVGSLFVLDLCPWCALEQTCLCDCCNESVLYEDFDQELLVCHRCIAENLD